MKKAALEEMKAICEAFDAREDIDNPDDTRDLNEEDFRRVTSDQTNQQLDAMEDWMKEHLTKGGFADKAEITRARSAGINVEAVPAQYPENDEPSRICLTTEHGSLCVIVEHEQYR